MREREKEGGREIKRKRQGEREKKGECKKEGEREREFLKGMTGALAPFSFLVN